LQTNRVQFKVPFGERDGELVSINQIPDSQRGLKCNCTCPNPECRAKLQARLGSSKKHHFAHDGSSGSHCSETYIHELGKRIILERVNRAIGSLVTELPFAWQCDKCPDKHRGNLIKNIKYGKAECSLETCRPDVTLFDGNDKPRLLIEIVVTRSPKLNVHQYAEENRCGLIEFHLAKMEELESLRDIDILTATKVSPCPQTKSYSRPEIGSQPLDSRLDPNVIKEHPANNQAQALPKRETIKHRYTGSGCLLFILGFVAVLQCLWYFC